MGSIVAVVGRSWSAGGELLYHVRWRSGEEFVAVPAEAASFLWPAQCLAFVEGRAGEAGLDLPRPVCFVGAHFGDGAEAGFDVVWREGRPTFRLPAAAADFLWPTAFRDYLGRFSLDLGAWLKAQTGGAVQATAAAGGSGPGAEEAPLRASEPAAPSTSPPEKANPPTRIQGPAGEVGGTGELASGTGELTGDGEASPTAKRRRVVVIGPDGQDQGPVIHDMDQAVQDCLAFQDDHFWDADAVGTLMDEHSLTEEVAQRAVKDYIQRALASGKLLVNGTAYSLV